jgi:hypothetical protein
VFCNERRCFLQVTGCQVQDSVSVNNTGGKENRGEAGKKRYIYTSSSDLIHILPLLVNEHKTAQPSSCTTTRHFMNEELSEEI